MLDREKVIKRVFEMLQRDTWKDIDKERHRFQPVLNDVLELLKKQEPIAPSICGSKEPDGHGSWWYMCGKCKKPIDHKDRFCKQCGQAVKWEQ